MSERKIVVAECFDGNCQSQVVVLSCETLILSTMNWLFWGLLASQAAAENERRQRAEEREIWGKDEWDDDEADDWDDLEDEEDDWDDDEY